MPDIFKTNINVDDLKLNRCAKIKFLKKRSSIKIVNNAPN